MRQRGSATLMVLSVLLVLSAMFAGAVAFIGMSARALRQNQLQQEAQGRLRSAAAAVVDELLADPTPFADSPIDPVWAGLPATRPGGITVELEDVSSRLGLNWIRKEVLADSGALKAGRSAQQVQQFREDAGLRVNLGTGYGEFIEAEALERLFTAYGWYNINISDEFVLRAVHRARGRDPGSAEQFHAAIQQARAARRLIEPAALEGFLGGDAWAVLFPVVNAEPAMNLHFVPEPVIELLFSHYHLPQTGVRAILDARRAAEMTPSVLEQLLGGDPGRSTLAPYLGLRTWFWRITVQQAGLRLSWIVARVPRPDGAPEFRLVEERFDP